MKNSHSTSDNRPSNNLDYADVLAKTAGGEHPRYSNVYKVLNTPGPLPQSLSQRLTEIPNLFGAEKGAPCRLVKSEHLIKSRYGHDIQPGQVCVVVETAGKGKGTESDGVHAVRARLPGEDRRKLMLARVEDLGDRYRLSWDSRPDVHVLPSDIAFVGTVVGTSGSAPAMETAPFLTLFSN